MDMYLRIGSELFKTILQARRMDVFNRLAHKENPARSFLSIRLPILLAKEKNRG